MLDNEMQVRGVGRLANQEQSDEPANDTGGGKAARKRKSDPVRDASVGAALRSVYSQTVDEAIPAEFLDLLNKLD
ncbi:NepR family anti-sigma factor [Rhizorhabdus wittichii]|nr:NepR family anti-sigma factor [Rhizorhabdus wittichii]